MNLTRKKAAGLFCGIFFNSLSGSGSVSSQRSVAEKAAVLDAISDRVNLKDRDFRFIWVNRAVEEGLSCPINDLFVESCFGVVYE